MPNPSLYDDVFWTIHSSFPHGVYYILLLYILVLLNVFIAERQYYGHSHARIFSQNFPHAHHVNN